MDATFAILGGAAIALYYFGKKKINKLQARIDQNELEDRQRENDLNMLADKIDNPLPDGDIRIYPYVQLVHATEIGNLWSGRVVWEIHNETLNTPYVITGIMSNLRLKGCLCTFLPANREMFPYKLEGGRFYTAYCTMNSFEWLDSRSKRKLVVDVVKSQKDFPHRIVECDVVLEIQNTATGKSFYKTFRNCKGDAILRSSKIMFGKAGSDAKDALGWSDFVKELP